MKSMSEQIGNKCIHFNGLHNNTCDAGVAYVEVRVEAANNAISTPKPRTSDA